jgi:phospholipase C
MSVKLLSLKGCLPGIKKGLASLMVLQLLVGAPLSALAEDRHERRNPARDTRTPIKHVIIIIGENRTFDHIFARLCPATERKSPPAFHNPVTSRSNPYVPLNSPAIGDMFDLFDFDHGDLDND